MICLNKVYFLRGLGLWIFLIMFWAPSSYLSQDSTLIYPIINPFDPTTNRPQSFDLGDPSSLTQNIVYDPISGRYIFTETFGEGMNYRPPSMMTLEEYIEYDKKTSIIENWEEKIDEQTEEGRPFELPIKIPGKAFKNFLDRIKLQFARKALWKFHLV